jgi:hypothetical protein
LQQDGDLIDQQLLAIVEKGGQNGGERFGTDVATHVLVLGDVRLRYMIPDLKVVSAIEEE